MKNGWMRSTSLLLCLMVCLGGSALASEGKVAMGRYVERQIELPADGHLSFAEAGGAFYCVDGDGGMLHHSANLNANEWDTEESGHDEQNAPAMGSVNSLAVGADGALYLSSGSLMRNEAGLPYVERIKGGQSERVQLDRALDSGSDRLAFCVLPSGELLALSYLEAYRFSPEGATLQKYAVPGGESIAAHEREMAICSTRDSLITVLDIESGQVLRTLPLPSAARYGVIGYDGNGALYYVSPDGLYQVNAGGTLMMQVADGRLMTAGKPNVWVLALLFDAENNPVIAYAQDGSTSLIAYHYDENVSTEPGTLLSVFTLYDNKTLRECANLFQQKYPDAMLDIIVALPQGTAVTRDDAIRTLNTEVLAGRGPDVIVLDGLPVQSYIDKGVLMDLSPVVQPMLDAGALLGNVAGAYKRGDAIPAVPARFLLPSLWGDVEGMKTLADMANWAQANPDSVPLYAVDVAPLIGTFYPSCAPAWFAEDGRLDEAKIEAFLTALQAIRGPWTAEAMAQKTGWSLQEGRAWNWNPYQPSLGGMDTEEDGRMNLWQGLQGQLPYLLRGLDNATYPNGALEDMDGGGFAPLPGQAEGCFVPVLLLGASKGAEHAEMALEFIECALGEESQNADLQEGFQVNVKALDQAQAREGALFGGVATSPVGGSGRMLQTIWLEPDQQKQLRGMIEALTTPVLPDFTLYQMMVAESTPFFDGEIDAAQAAANVCAKANTYLSE